MSSTDDQAAAGFFAEYLLPLKRANERRGVHYFTTGADKAKDSYWEPIASRNGGIRSLDAVACDGAALIKQLGDYWTERNQAQLTRLLPALETLRQGASKPAGDDQQAVLTDFIYPLH